MILRASITQHTTDEVFLRTSDPFCYNPTNAQLDAQIDAADASRIVITADNEIFDSGQPARYYTSNSAGDRYVVVPINRNQVEIRMYTAAGVSTSNILNHCEFEV